MGVSMRHSGCLNETQWVSHENDERHSGHLDERHREWGVSSAGGGGGVGFARSSVVCSRPELGVVRGIRGNALPQVAATAVAAAEG